MKNQIKILFIALFFLMTAFLNFGEVKAQTDDLYGYGAFQESSLGDRDPRRTTISIIKVSLTLIGTICTVLIIYAGFLWMTAGGNEDQVGKAKKILIGAIIGAIIVFTAYSITRFISKSIYGSTQYYGDGLDIGITGDGTVNID